MSTRRRALLAAVVSVLVTACSEKAPPPPAAVPVTVATAVTKPMPVRIEAVGTVAPAETVTVRSQVTGPLAEVHFVEGQDVTRGALLFTIDPRPFRAALEQAQAEQARNATAAEFARREGARYAELFKQGLVARSQYEQLIANANAADALVRASRAAVETARLQLSYTAVRAPLDGRTGRLLADRGTLVQANATDLVVINRLRPIEVAFAVPAQHLPELGRRPSGSIEVAATPAGLEAGATGRLTFLDNRVDPQTGTIQLKATFGNEDARLWPGQFVNVVVTLGVEPDALVIPAAAVQTGQQGPYVFVVRPDGTVESRPVAVARQLGEEVVLAQGVAPGEPVVTEGQLRLTAGARVEVQAPAASPPSPPAPPAPGRRS
jgi:multidrug efflux system membrane fusion protein